MVERLELRPPTSDYYHGKMVRGIVKHVKIGYTEKLNLPVSNSQQNPC